MKPATCPTHGRDHLVNAGAPNIVRCVPGEGCQTSVLEPCRHCRGTGWAVLFSLLPGGEDEAVSCRDCEESGWVVRRKPLQSPYPVY